MTKGRNYKKYNNVNICRARECQALTALMTYTISRMWGASEVYHKGTFVEL